MIDQKIDVIKMFVYFFPSYFILKMNRLTKFVININQQWANIKSHELQDDEIRPVCDLCNKISTHVLWIEKYPRHKRMIYPAYFCHKHCLLPIFLERFSTLEIDHLLELVEDIRDEDDELELEFEFDSETESGIDG
jgi:hypothetical protein